jgi:hypothetical protein
MGTQQSNRGVKRSGRAADHFRIVPKLNLSAVIWTLPLEALLAYTEEALRLLLIVEKNLETSG